MELTFNPYKKEARLTVDGKERLDAAERLCGREGDDLETWAGDFWKRAAQYFNTGVEVVFNGIQRDCDILNDALRVFLAKDGKGTGCVLRPGKIAEPKHRLEELRNLFEKMQKESPFPSLQEEKLKHSFDRATNSEFELAVVATMSSGKSTLLNAILGNDLLPARNEGTTANIVRICDDGKAKGFRARAFDEEGKLLDECKSLSLEWMDEQNNKLDTAVVEVRGKIPQIESQSLNLVLLDTPGPNNSATDLHCKITMDLLKDPYKPMVLYVLNTEQMEANDDDDLLKKVAKAMKAGDRQTRDRFLFVLNRVDALDPDRDGPLSATLDKMDKYLNRHDIHGARIFPTAALMAKTMRKSLAGRPLTEKEEDEFLLTSTYVKRPWRHYSDGTPERLLSPKFRNAAHEQEKRLLDAAETGGERAAEELVLWYTGVPAVELAVSEYLEMHALPIKISKGVDTFKERIKALHVYEDAQKSIEEDDQKLADFAKKLEKLDGLLEKGEKAKQVKKQIEALSVEKELEAAQANATAKLSSFLRAFGEGKEEIPESEVQPMLARLKGEIGHSKAEFSATIEKVLNDLLVARAKTCVETYKDYVRSILGEVKIQLPPEAVLGDTASIHLDVSGFMFGREETIGTQQVENDGFRAGVARFFGWKSFWGRSAYKTVPKRGVRRYMDFDKFMNKQVIPQILAFMEGIGNLANEWAQEKVKDMKDQFLSSIDHLDKVLRDKRAETANLSKNKELRTQSREKHARQLAWLEQFTRELDTILEI
jgi:predicted GTPase